MTTSATPPEESYQESADYSWTEKAFEMLERHDLHGEVISRGGIIRSRVWGPCPRCEHDLDDQQTHTAVTNLMGGQRRDPSGTGPGQLATGDPGPVFFQVDVSCGCGTSHVGAPGGRPGCGASFRVELPLNQAGDQA
jgi:hypothetical protein